MHTKKEKAACEKLSSDPPSPSSAWSASTGKWLRLGSASAAFRRLSEPSLLGFTLVSVMFEGFGCVFLRLAYKA